MNRFILSIAILLLLLGLSCGIEDASGPKYILYDTHNIDYIRDYDYADNRIFDLGYPVGDYTDP